MTELNIALADYLWRARECNESSYQPPGYGQRYRTPMFEFIRRAKAHPSLEHLEASEAASVVEQYLKAWSEANATNNLWQACFQESDDPRAEFVVTWDRIKWPQALLGRAVAEAERLPLNPVRSCSAGYSKFVSIVGHLQRLVQDPIMVPCRKFADLLGCQPMTITRYREFAKTSGLLKLICRGSKAQHKADEFTFAVELFDWKTGEQIPSENLNICITSSPKCYTEIQDIERKKEIQEKQEKKETQEMQRETRAQLPEKRKCAIRQGPYIPTTAELEQELQETAHLRGF